MPNEVINTIHQLVAACNKYKGIVLTDKDGNINNDENDDTEDNVEITGVDDEDYSPPEEIYSPPEEIYSPTEESYSPPETHKKTPSSQEWNKITPINTKMMTIFRTINKNMTTISILLMTTYRSRRNCPRKLM